MLFDYLKETYGEGQPIFISRIEYNGMSRNAIRLQVMRLTEEGKLLRYDTGIYYIPQKTDYAFVPTLSRSTVIAKKYLLDDGGGRCGYYSGLILANQLGLTTQVPATRTVVTNKASRNYRVVRIGNANVILRKPKATVDDNNYFVLAFLDLLKDIDMFDEFGYPETGKILTNFIISHNISGEDVKRYLPLYPDRTYKNMIEVGLLDVLSA